MRRGLVTDGLQREFSRQSIRQAGIVIISQGQAPERAKKSSNDLDYQVNSRLERQ